MRRETGRGLFLRKGEIMEILRAANAEIAMRRILQAAVSEKASDVHLEPCREFVLVRFRIDGTLTERYRLPLDMAAGLKTAFPRTEAFRKSGKEKIQISVFP